MAALDQPDADPVHKCASFLFHEINVLTDVIESLYSFRLQ